MIIYGSSVSPFVRKALVFASEKGIEVEVRDWSDPGFRQASPFGLMPALRDGDFTLADSTAIIAYIDALHPEPNLIPVEAKARGRAIWFEEFADTLLTATARVLFRQRVVEPQVRGKPGDLDAAAKAEREELPPQIDYLERELPASGWLVEDRLTLADIAVASAFVTAAYGGWRKDAQRWPKTTAFLERLYSRPAFERWLALSRERFKDAGV